MTRSEFYSVYFRELDSIPAERRRDFDFLVLPRLKNPVIIFGASCWLGMFGLDRFLLGQVWLGLAKLFTLGGLLIWMIVDCANNEPSKGNDKVIWILVIVLAGWVGAIIYYFARRPTRMRDHGR